MLSAEQLNSIRETVGTSLPDRCAIVRNTRTQDAVGGWSDAWADVAVSVPCRLGTASTRRQANEQLAAQQLHPDADWTVTMPADTDVTTDDRIRIDTLGGRLLEVLGVSGPRSWSAETVAGVREL